MADQKSRIKAFCNMLIRLRVMLATAQAKLDGYISDAVDATDWPEASAYLEWAKLYNETVEKLKNQIRMVHNIMRDIKEEMHA